MMILKFVCSGLVVWITAGQTSGSQRAQGSLVDAEAYFETGWRSRPQLIHLLRLMFKQTLFYPLLLYSLLVNDGLEYINGQHHAELC